VYNNDGARQPGRPPDLSMPRRPRRRMHTRLTVAAVIAACALGVAAALQLLPRPAGEVPAAPLTVPSARAGSGSVPVQPGSAGVLLPDPGVYRLLPVTASQLAAAVGVAAAFTDAYGTYSYTQPASAYLARLRPYTAPGLQAELAQAATAPGLRQQRARNRVSITTTATVTAVRDIASTTVTFVVTARQVIRSQHPAIVTVKEYAVTVVRGSGGWQVYDIEPADVGQAGSIS